MRALLCRTVIIAALCEMSRACQATFVVIKLEHVSINAAVACNTYLRIRGGGRVVQGATTLVYVATIARFSKLKQIAGV